MDVDSFKEVVFKVNRIFTADNITDLKDLLAMNDDILDVLDGLKQMKKRTRQSAPIITRR